MLAVIIDAAAAAPLLMPLRYFSCYFTPCFITRRRHCHACCRYYAVSLMPMRCFFDAIFTLFAAMMQSVDAERHYATSFARLLLPLFRFRRYFAADTLFSYACSCCRCHCLLSCCHMPFSIAAYFAAFAFFIFRAPC